MVPMTSRVELRTRLDELRWERALAEECGLSDCIEYMLDLEDELAECLHELKVAIVVEIAGLRGGVFGMQIG